MTSKKEENQLLIFPTSRAIREFINSSKGSNQLLPTILTIDEFLKKSIDIGNKKFIDNDLRFLYLRQAIDFNEFKALGISSNFSDFLKQSEYLFQFFTELSSEMVSIEDIESADTYAHYQEHLEILKSVHTNYTALLEKEGYIDKITLPNNYKINQDFISSFDKIKLFFEGYFTKLEFEIINKISDISTTYIELLTTPYNKKSIQQFQNLGFNLKNNYKYLLNLSKRTTEQETPLIARHSQLATDIAGFASRINQIAFIKHSIYKMIQNNIAPEKIVIILPDESFASIMKLFDNENYFNFAMGIDIKNSLTNQYILAITNYINEPEQQQIDRLDFLKIDKNFCDNEIVPFWNRQITQERFMQILDFVKKTETNLELINKFDEEVYRLNRLFFTNSQQILLKEAFKILLQRVSKITLDDINSGPITVMGLLETRGVSYDGVIVVDFNDETVPKRSLKDKFLSTTVKSIANLPTSIDRQNLQKYYYSKLFFNAKEVYISYTHNEQSTISRFATSIFNLDNKAMQKTYDNEYKHILYKESKLKLFDKDIILNIDLSARSWSATSFKSYLECKRKYYLKYIAKIDEHYFGLKPQGFEVGNIIHKILEEFYKKEKKQVIENKDLFQLFSKYQNINPYLTFDLEIWKRKLNKFVKNEKQRFLNGTKVYTVEQPFKFIHNGIELKGKIDRIDKTNNKYEILDYKTSSNLKIDKLSTYEKSKDFQLEFYYLGFQSLVEPAASIIPYYYNLNDGTLNLETVLDEKLVLLDKLLSKLKTKQVNFSKCEERSICAICAYNTMCGRD